jgi:prepilin-type N-terminal cleavage/methylation domain-containing protein
MTTADPTGGAMLNVTRLRGDATDSRAGLTFIELLVVMTIFAILMGLLIVMINSSISRARNVQCLSNLRQLALTFRTYAAPREGRLPTEETAPWFVEIGRHGNLAPDLFQCPADPDAEPLSYEWRDDFVTVPTASLAGKKIDFVANQRLILVFDRAPGWHSPDHVNAAALDANAQSYEINIFEDNLFQGVATGEPFYLGG